MRTKAHVARPVAIAASLVGLGVASVSWAQDSGRSARRAPSDLSSPQAAPMRQGDTTKGDSNEDSARGDGDAKKGDGTTGDEARGSKRAASAPVARVETEPRRADDQRSDPDPRRDSPDGAGACDRGWSCHPRPDASLVYEVAPDDDESRLRWIPRTLFLGPRLALELVSAPVRGSLWLYDRYQLGARAKRLFFNDEGTFGVYPILSLQDGFGLSAGARLVHHDLVGAGEGLTMSAKYGGRYTQSYEVALDSGERLDDAELQLEAFFELHPKERFFGIGNGDQVAVDETTMNIDPLTSDSAYATRFRDVRQGASGQLEVEIVGPFSVATLASWERRRFFASEDLSGDSPIQDVYDVERLPGFEDSAHNLNGGVGLQLDTRHQASPFVSAAMPAAGAFVEVHAGYSQWLSSGRPGYARTGGDAQYFVDLYRGSRTLGFRLMAEQLHGELDEIPFVHLPALGGDDLLRGYESGRFRDRALTLASVEYKWQIAPRALAAFLFVDAGRVHRSLADVELRGLRMGYGAGLQAHTLNSFLARGHLASSVDGGVFVNLDLTPVTDIRAQEASSE